jgi:GNAT superfamily N-acetyltransferase
VSRMPVQVRDAVESDAGGLATLWRDVLVRPGAEGVGLPSETQAQQAIARFTESKDTRVLVADIEGEVVGGIFLRVSLLSPLHADRALHLSHLQVDRRFIRHGVGRALLEAAVTWAEQLGVETVLAGAPAADRDANRFLARLGLAQVAVLRFGSTAALRAKLPHDPSLAARVGVRKGRNVGQVVAARRSQRRARGQDSLA